MNDSQATSSRSTGPIRPRLVKPSHPLPYARDVAATAEQGEPQQQHEEEGLLARVKSIVSWLVPGWLGSPQKCRPATTARHHSELAHADAASQTMLLDKERPGVGAMAMVEDRPLAEELLQRITSGKGSRAYLYEELAQFFKLKESLNVHLSQEEYERLAYVIQRQEMPRPRPPLATPLPKSHSTMMSSMASASTVSRRRTARRSPRRTPSLSSVCEPQPMTDEKLAVRPPGFARPAAVPRKARVYSARFDESDDLVVTAGVSGERKEREDDRMGLTKPVSESRKRLVEEARQRVAEQIRLAQLPPKPEDAAEGKAVRGPEQKDEAGKRELSPILEETKPAFSFTIPLQASAAPERKKDEENAISTEAPKLIFDFGSAVSVESKGSRNLAPSEPSATPAFSLDLSGSKPAAAEPTANFNLADRKPLPDLTTKPGESKPSFSFGSGGGSGGVALPPGPSSAAAEEKPKAAAAFSFGPMAVGDEPAPPSLFNVLATPTKGPLAAPPSLSFSFAQGPVPAAATTTMPPQPTESDSGSARTSKLNTNGEGSALPSGFNFGAVATSTSAAKPAAPSFGVNASAEAKPVFSFGSTASSDTKPAFSFGTGASSAPATKPSPPSLANPSAAVTEPQAAPKPSFSFGVAATENNKPITFGIPSTGAQPVASFGAPSTTTATAKSPLSFGSPAAAAAADTGAAKSAFSPGGPLSFGQSESKPAAAAATGPAFSFGAPSQPSTASASGFSLGNATAGTAAATRPFSFGGGADVMTDSRPDAASLFSLGTQPEAKPAFTFGRPAESSAPPSAASTLPGFGMPVPTPTAGGFSFGVAPAPTFAASPAAPAAPLNFNFGTSQPAGDTPFTFGAGSTPAGGGAFSAGAAGGPRKFSVPQRRKK